MYIIYLVWSVFGGLPAAWACFIHFVGVWKMFLYFVAFVGTFLKVWTNMYSQAACLQPCLLVPFACDVRTFAVVLLTLNIHLS